MTNSVIIEEVDIETSDGSMNCHFLRPKSSSSVPGVIVYMPASGVRDELVDIASQIAQLGYAVVLPNLYYRLARTVDIDANRLGTDEYLGVQDYMIALADHLSNDRVQSDTAAIISWMDSQVTISSQQIGGVGYCMGGRLVMASLGAHSDRMIAAASLYGAGVATDQADSPHLQLDRCEGELYFGLAENDKYVTDEETAILREHLVTLSVPHSIETYPGTEHGFVFPERYCFNPEQTLLHYARIKELFERWLS